MHRFWATFTLLGAANLAIAGILAFSIPTDLQVENHFRPYMVVSPDRGKFEHKVRPIIRTEIEDLLGASARNTSTTPSGSSVRTVRQTERTGGPQQPTFPFTTVSRPAGFNVSVQPRAAWLTPFGVYSSGPAGFGLVVLSFGALLLGSVMTMYLVPRRLRVVKDAVTVSWPQRMRLGGVGLLALLLGVLLTLVLTTLVIGVPIAALLLLVLTLGVFFGLVVVGLALGNWLAHLLHIAPVNPIAQVALGMLLLFPMGVIPVLGWALVLVVSSLGFGAILVTKFGSQEGWSLDALTGGEDVSLA